MTATPATAPTCCGMSAGTLSARRAQELAAVLKALGDPVRLRMLSMIAARPELCVCEITPAFELTSATISHHLKALRTAGLIGCQRRGTYVYYWVEPAARETVDAVLALP